MLKRLLSLFITPSHTYEGNAVCTSFISLLCFSKFAGISVSGVSFPSTFVLFVPAAPDDEDTTDVIVFVCGNVVFSRKGA